MIMYLCEEHWRKTGVRKDTEILWYTQEPNMFAQCTKYADALNEVRLQKGIQSNFNKQITRIDKNNRRVYFFDTKTKEEVGQDYDFLHIVPPQSAPTLLEESGVAAPNGWLDVDYSTLRHNRVDNVFGLGDCANLPTSKTAAGVFEQAPIVTQNILRQMKKLDLNGHYQGYQSCPLYVGDKLGMLAEFKYNGQPDETFSTYQTDPSYPIYLLKKELFPRVYFSLAPRGRWFGRSSIFRPEYN